MNAEGVDSSPGQFVCPSIRLFLRLLGVNSDRSPDRDVQNVTSPPLRRITLYTAIICRGLSQVVHSVCGGDGLL